MIKRLVIGNLATDEIVEPGSQLNISASSAVFEPIATFVMATMGFAALTEAYGAGDGRAHRWRPEDVALFDAYACDLRLEIAPADIASRIVQNWWPDQISFRCSTLPPLNEPPRLNLGSLEHFLFGLSQGMFTSFYENHKDSIRQVHGDEAKRWPAAWAFGRVIRNALSHGGNLDIRGPTNVCWKKLAYTQADHGRRVVNVDLWPGDFFILLTEMEAEL